MITLDFSLVILKYVNFSRQIKYKINKGLPSGRAQFKYFPNALSKNLLHYIDRTLEDHSFEVAIIHIGVNDIISKRSSSDFDHVLKNIKNIVQKYGRIFLFQCCYKQHVLQQMLN